jgi:GTPase SAR1 family protein
VHARSCSYNELQVLVVGETGVGKSTFVQAVCGGEPGPSAQPGTIGASVQVLLHAHHAGTPQECDYFVELFDIGE